MSDRKLPSSLPHSSSTRRTGNKKRDGAGEGMFQEGPYDPVRGEVAMWQAVLTQALMDAASGSSKPEAQQEKAEALRWLKGDSLDFMTVCLNAGFDPAYARRMIRRALARNCRWRAEPQKKHSLAAIPVARRPLLPAPVSVMRELPQLTVRWGQERMRHSVAEEKELH